MYHIESRKLGNKRWQRHVSAPYRWKERAENEIDDWKVHGTADPGREYRVTRSARNHG